MTEEQKEEISLGLDNALNEIMTAYTHFVQKGYIGLFPKDLGDMILTFNLQAAVLNNNLKEKGLVNKETQKSLKAVISTGEEIRNRIRKLLNVEALD